MPPSFPDPGNFKNKYSRSWNEYPKGHGTHDSVPLVPRTFNDQQTCLGRNSLSGEVSASENNLVHLVAPELGFKPSSLVKVQTESSAIAGTPYLKDIAVFHSQAHSFEVLVVTKCKGQQEN